jgi:anhydro-N-acetylmuramic acid kinase
MASELYVGLMSGTSLDGIDAVLACFDRPQAVVASHFQALPADLRAELASLLRPGSDELHRSALAAHRLGAAYAGAVRELLQRAGVPASRIRAIGCHGQTVRHAPAQGYTIQIGDGALLAELTGITTICDFRSRDIAAGGQGAPLVPAFHAHAFAHPAVDRAIVNIGGIANITYLPANGAVIGFDCGPGNALLDEWIQEQRGLSHDAEGAWAAQGQAIPVLLSRLLSADFFTRSPPKSTGREAFNLAWVRPNVDTGATPEDVQATLSELTAGSIAQAIQRFCPGTREVYVCGGGASNLDLMRRLGQRLGGITLSTTASIGIDPDWVEAVAFAWLARETLEGRPGNLPGVTGARGPRVLGCIYPA